MTRIRFEGFISVPFALASWRTLLPISGEINELRVAQAVVHWRQAGRPSELFYAASKRPKAQVNSMQSTRSEAPQTTMAHRSDGMLIRIAMILNYFSARVDSATASAWASAARIAFGEWLIVRLSMISWVSVSTSKVKPVAPLNCG